MRSPTISEAISKFVWACEADELKHETVVWYKAMLNPFKHEFGSRALMTISTDDMRAFVIETQRTAGTENTANDRIRALRRFWAWSSAEWGLNNPMARIRQK